MTEALAKAPGPWTLADLASLPDDGQRYEIVDGSLLVSPPPTLLHQAVTDRVRRLLRAAAGPDFEVLEGVGVQLPNGLLVPDVVVAHGEAVWSGRSVLRPADLVLAVEVVSSSSTTTDRVTKPALTPPPGYRRTGASSWEDLRRHPSSPTGSGAGRTPNRPPPLRTSR